MVKVLRFVQKMINNNDMNDDLIDIEIKMDNFDNDKLDEINIKIKEDDL